MLFVALGSYGVLMSIHWYIEKRIEREAFYVSKANGVSKINLYHTSLVS